MIIELGTIETVVERHGPAWNALIGASGSGVAAIDITAGAEWNLVLARMLRDTQDGSCLFALEDGELCGVMPLFVESSGVGVLRRRKLAALTEVYSNRPGIVAADPGRFAEAVFGYLVSGALAWDEFALTVTADSRSHQALRTAAAASELQIDMTAELESPYIEFQSSWDACLAALPKKFRWLLRSSRSKLEDAGRVEYRHYSSNEALTRFIAEIEDIERASWKEDAGTSITQNDNQQGFYHQFLPIAAERGWLSGHTLMFDGDPMAYILGMEFGGVCVDLKESYKEKYRSHSPGHVLKTYAFPGLIERGIATYDFSGVCEPYKMKWTDKTYRRCRYTVLGRSLNARLRARLRRR